MRTNNTTVINDIDKIVMGISRSQILQALRGLGKAGLEYAQERHAFKNRTFNLEDSYGYAIYYNGVLIEKTLSDSKSSKAKEHNGKMVTGNEMLEDFINNFKASKGYTLIVVAGMFYALWVEKKHGLDVLLGSYNSVSASAGSYFKTWYEI